MTPAGKFRLALSMHPLTQQSNAAPRMAKATDAHTEGENGVKIKFHVGLIGGSGILQ